MPCIRSSSVVVALLLAVLALAGPAAGAREQHSSNLFQRVTRALQSVGSAVTGIGSASAVDVMGEALTSVLDEQQQRAGSGVDTWATDGVLKLAMQAFKGGQLGVLGQLGRAEELRELWSQPEGVRMLLDNFTLFRGIKKMAAIADKEGPLTPEDVSMNDAWAIDRSIDMLAVPTNARRVDEAMSSPKP